MKASTARLMAWSIGILSIALMIAGLIIMFVDRHVVLPEVSDSWTFSSVLDVTVNIAVPAIGLVIASRRRENPLGWLLLAAGLGLGVVSFSRAYAVHALVADPGSFPAGRAFAWLSNWLWTVCATGHRAAMAASLLDRDGIPVRLVTPGGVPDVMARIG